MKYELFFCIIIEMYSFKYYIFSSCKYQSKSFNCLYLYCKRKYMYEIRPTYYGAHPKNTVYTFYHEKCNIYVHKPENVIIQDNSIKKHSFRSYQGGKYNKFNVCIDFW